MVLMLLHGARAKAAPRGRRPHGRPLNQVYELWRFEAGMAGCVAARQVLTAHAY